jgi:hypothetical protein
VVVTSPPPQPPLSTTKICFSTNLWNIAKKIARNIQWMLFTFISDLKIIRQAVKPLGMRMPHITTQWQYHFAPKLYRRIGLKSHLRASRYTNFPGEDPRPPAAARLRRAWVLTFGEHIVHPKPNFWIRAVELWTPCKKSWIRPWNVLNLLNGTYIPKSTEISRQALVLFVKVIELAAALNCS